MALSFKKTGDVKSPVIATEGSAGIDLFLPTDLYLPRNSKVLVDLCVAVAIPPGYVGILSPRSSSGKVDLGLANTIGWIDSDYRDSIKAYLRYAPTNDLKKPLQQGVKHGGLALKGGTRVCQLILVPYFRAEELIEVDDLGTTERLGGFGSTGKE